MKRKILNSGVVLLFVLSFSAIQAQEAIPATGGEASGSGGSASYTVGQVFYSTNSGASGSVVQGVQQPYEISVAVGLEEANGIDLECVIFPNPTTDMLKLVINNQNTRSLSYQLYDVNGKVLLSEKLIGNSHIIKMENLIPATYFLKVTDHTKELKTFSIIKN